mmetsp:Transcript_7788/g.13415  ORF Transcript_7788/g.13415 Transcript_7788/m.13415 type:complete len:96 (+) Transcript_7788:760-1047(+)
MCAIPMSVILTKKMCHLNRVRNATNADFPLLYCTAVDTSSYYVAADEHLFRAALASDEWVPGTVWPAGQDLPGTRCINTSADVIYSTGMLMVWQH